MVIRALTLILMLGVQTQCTPPPARNCPNPLVYNDCGSDEFECVQYVDGFNFFPQHCYYQGCFCDVSNHKTRYLRVNRDGSIDCVDGPDCHNVTGHAPCSTGGLFCLNDKLCYCAGATPTCTIFSCNDSDSGILDDLKGCWVYRPYGGQFIAPCPKDEAIFDISDANDLCYLRPTARFCLANDDCKTCFCDMANNVFGHCKDQACPDIDVNKGKCVVEKHGNCAFASEVINYFN